MLAPVAVAKPSKAAFPVATGLIVFTGDRTTTANPDGDGEIMTMKPDGTSVTQLTDNTAGDFDFAPTDFDPAFSADGTSQKNRTRSDEGDDLPGWQPLQGRETPGAYRAGSKRTPSSPEGAKRRRGTLAVVV